MQKPNIPHNEIERQTALDELEILDTQAEDSFDDLTILASQICGTKISLISLVDRNRQWFKSRVGLGPEETPRDISWCGHAILGDGIFEVPDAALDERFKDNPLFLGEPHVRFYAGVPLVTKGGHKIGTLCVIDTTSKKLTPWQIEVLHRLSRQAVILIESRLREQKLIDANTKLDAVVNNIPVMLSSYNERGEIDWVNREWEKELGWDPADLKKIDVLAELYPEKKLQKEAREFSKYNQPVWKDFYTRKKNGHSFYTTWTIVKLQNEHFIGIGQNIHDRKSNETLSQDVQRLTKVGGWQYLIESEEIKWTEETFNIHALPVSKGVNLSAAINCYAPHERERIADLIKRGIQEGLPWNEEFEFFDVKGNHKWVKSIGEAVKTQDGKIYKLKGTFQDITEIKNLQLKLESERRISLHQAKLASIGQLASGVAHEINNPLAIIKGYLTVIKESNELNADTLSRLDKINNAANRIKNIVNGLRTFSRSDIEEIKLFDLGEVLKESIDLVSEIYLKENISLTLEYNKTDEIVILGNRGRMAQVLINLLANAKDANAKLASRIINVSLLKDKDTAVLKVKDNGKGIDRRIKEKIFDPFFTTKDVNEGTGIGLSIVNSIVKEHEGQISFESVVNKGTTFTIKLPIGNSSVSTKIENEEKKYFSANLELNALIVDDEEDIRSILNILLSRIGIKVTLATNGVEAMHAYTTKEYDLLLTDLKMPTMNGISLIKEIRSNLVSKQPKIILMTGGVESDSLPEIGDELLIDGFIYKPFNNEDLYGKLQEIFPEKNWEAAKR